MSPMINPAACDLAFSQFAFSATSLPVVAGLRYNASPEDMFIREPIDAIPNEFRRTMEEIFVLPGLRTVPSEWGEIEQGRSARGRIRDTNKATGDSLAIALRPNHDGVTLTYVSPSAQFSIEQIAHPWRGPDGRVEYSNKARIEAPEALLRKAGEQTSGTPTGEAWREIVASLGYRSPSTTFMIASLFSRDLAARGEPHGILADTKEALVRVDGSPDDRPSAVGALSIRGTNEKALARMRAEDEFIMSHRDSESWRDVGRHYATFQVVQLPSSFSGAPSWLIEQQLGVAPERRGFSSVVADVLQAASMMYVYPPFPLSHGG